MERRSSKAVCDDGGDTSRSRSSVRGDHGQKSEEPKISEKAGFNSCEMEKLEFTEKVSISLGRDVKVLTKMLEEGAMETRAESSLGSSTVAAVILYIMQRSTGAKAVPAQQGKQEPLPQSPNF